MLGAAFDLWAESAGADFVSDLTGDITIKTSLKARLASVVASAVARSLSALDFLFGGDVSD